MENIEGQTAKPASLFDLAEKNGHTFTMRGKNGELLRTVPAHDSLYKRWHLVASVLHGWELHEREHGAIVDMSEEDYLAALEAAKQGKTHEPAMKRKGA